MLKRLRQNLPLLTIVFLLAAILFKRIFLHKLAPEAWGHPQLLEFAANAVHNAALTLFALGAIYWCNLQRNAGLDWRRSRDWSLVLWPFIPIVLMFIIRLNAGLGDVDASIVASFFIAMLMVGFSEEFVFRGFVQSLWLKRLGAKRAVWLAAVLFGLMHYIGLVREPDNFSGVTSQVIFAIATGVYFGALQLRTRWLIIPAVLHGLVDFVGATDEILPPKPEPSAPASAYGPDDPVAAAFSYGLTALIFLLPLIAGLILLKNLPPEPNDDTATTRDMARASQPHSEATSG